MIPAAIASDDMKANRQEKKRLPDPPNCKYRSTHFFGGSGSSSAGGDQSRTSRSPPVGRQTDDGGLSDFLGSSGPQSQGRTGGAGTAASGGGGDRYGLFTAAGDAGSGSVGGSRVAQSRARYNTLFGEEVRV